jgi:hypothetical protein
MGIKAQEKHALLEAMVKDNVKPSIIAKTLDYTPEHVSRLKKQSKAYQLVTSKRVRQAAKAIDYFVDIENYQGGKIDKVTGEIIPPDTRIKPSDVISASNVYLSRSHPIIQHIESQNLSITITQEVDDDIKASLIRQGLI